MKRAMVLLGAGASVEFKVPSTGSLTNKIENEVMADGFMKMTGGDAAFQTIKAGLAGYLQKPGNVNFEQIYHCAHELIFTCPPPLGAYDEFKPVMQPFVSNTTGLTEEALRALCGKMVEIIFREVSSSCDGCTLDLKPLARFVEALRADYVTRVYTTNYDDLLLQAVPELYTGFDATLTSGPKRFEVDSYWRKECWDGIFHLHGSVRMGFTHPPHGEIGELLWFDNRTEALVHSSFSGSSPRRMDGTSVLRTAVITGLEKLSRVQQRPFSHFYSMMARDAMRSDIIFVIGSGLADLHLNTWLAEARSRSPKPPLLFVDYWPSGFENDAYFVADRKTIALFHRLQVHVTADYPGNRVGNWIVSKDGNAAIWAKGFQAFLNSPAELRTVLPFLKGAPLPSPLRRLWRRAYRGWTQCRRCR
jgi:hypothetical protein